VNTNTSDQSTRNRNVEKRFDEKKKVLAKAVKQGEDEN
jgi:hypothetical protein